EFIGQAGNSSSLNSHNLFHNKLSNEHAARMVRQVSSSEVKSAIFSMGNDKSPGPDGYTSAFFKEAWDVVGDDVVSAVQEFFVNGILLKELNHTIIALIPKISTPVRITDYRPISCCNVLFKCISKIISNRIKEGLNDLVSSNQSAFVPGRRISDSILLTQELMHNYHLDRGPPRCAFKIEIQKAYDTVDWGFLKDVLVGFGFHSKMVAWIKECVSSTSFSLSINGVLHGVYESEEFVYHHRCSKLNIVNLCFADDLFLFSHGDVNSAHVIKDSLDEFKTTSGLVPSLPKSTAYFCNVLNHVKLSIINVMPFIEGTLPVKHLGVPLISTRLVYRDCKELHEKVQNIIADWKNKFLSFAGKLQLVQSVASSMHVYWASCFILPSRIILDIEQLMQGFLWCQGEMRKGKAKVSWESVCLPMNEGGLGIRMLDTFNVAFRAVSKIQKFLWALCEII
ncbi:putative RNA-directed DNA polymerase, partial [Tanacetum coccineum]